MKTSILLFIFLAATALSAAPAVGDKAPAFSLKDIHGNAFNSEELGGKTVVLEWINPHCPFVKKFYNDGHMVQFQKAAAEMGVVWISVSSNRPGAPQYMTPEENRVWAEKVGHSATWLVDPEGTMGKAYGAAVTPHMFVINTEGNVVYQGAIDSIRDANPDSVDGAQNYVMEALNALKEGRAIAETRTRPYGCGIKY